MWDAIKDGFKSAWNGIVEGAKFIWDGIWAGIEWVGCIVSIGIFRLVEFLNIPFIKLIGLFSDDTNFRSLNNHEKKVLKKVFKSSLNYNKIRIQEGAGVIMGVSNMWNDGAFCTGNNIYFKGNEIEDFTLVHEAIHVWQYQNKDKCGFFARGFITGTKKTFGIENPYDWEKEINQERKNSWKELNLEAQAEFFEDLWKLGEACDSEEPGDGVFFEVDWRNSVGNFETEGVEGGEYTIFGKNAVEYVRNEGSADSQVEWEQPEMKVEPTKIEFWPKCQNKDTITKKIKISHLKTSSNNERRIPLCIRKFNLGYDDDVIEVTKDADQIPVLQEGEEIEVGIEIENQYKDKSRNATLSVDTFSSSKEVDISVNRKPSKKLTVTPDKVNISGMEEVFDCPVDSTGEVTIRNAKESITIEHPADEPKADNTENTYIRLCDIDIINKSGGRWSYTPIERDDSIPDRVLLPGEKRRLILEYMPEIQENGNSNSRFPLPEYYPTNTATLRIETQNEIVKKIELEGHITPAKEDNDVKGLVSTIPISGNEWCFDLDKITQWEKMKSVINGKFDELSPECCPGEEQPKCQCKQFIEFNFREEPDIEGIKFKKDQPYFELNNSQFIRNILVPYPDDGKGEIEITSANGNHPLKGSIRHWQITKENTFIANNPIKSVSKTNGAILAITDRKLHLLKLQGKTIKDISEHEFAKITKDFTAYNKKILISTDSGLLTGILKNKEFEMGSMQSFPTLDCLISRNTTGDNTQVIFGFKPNHILKLATNDFDKFNIADETTSKIKSLETYYISNNSLILGGSNGIEIFSIRNGDLNNEDFIKLDNIVSIFQVKNSLYAIDHRSELHLLRINDDSNMENLGNINLYGDWSDMLSSGTVIKAGNKFLARSFSDRNKINVYSYQLGKA
mgnify:CR=1 FL=1